MTEQGEVALGSETEKASDDKKEKKPGPLDKIATAVQTISVVVGVVISVLSFNAARQAESLARLKEAEARNIASAKPFTDLRQTHYSETIKVAAILANPDTHTSEEMAAAKKRFRELYVAELSMVESDAVSASMYSLATIIDPDLNKMTPAQHSVYELSHALRDSFADTYGAQIVQGGSFRLLGE